MRFALRVLAALVVLGGSVAARAETIGFSLSVFGTTISLDNTSDTATIDALSLTIGDASFNFDLAAALGVTPNATLVAPDAVDGGVRSDVLQFTFVGFGPGLAFDASLGVDTDGGAPSPGLSGVLFNNGAATNAQLSLVFSNGFILDFVLPDTQAGPDPDGLACPTDGSCLFATGFAVPEPALALLLAGAFAALVARRRSA